MRLALLAEFDSPRAALDAARGLRTLGYTALDLHSPYPLAGAAEALGLPRSRLPIAVLAAAVVGGAGAYFMQWWMNAVDYPLAVGGRPAHFPLAFVPVSFELLVLAAAFAAVGTFFALAGLPRLWHQVFEAPGFDRASIDRFWLSVEGHDPRFDPERTSAELTRRGALAVVLTGGDR